MVRSAGMSYHGGFIGGIVGMVLWTIRNKKPFLAWCDTMAASVPLRYTFGRLGNFLNGELYGRVTTSPLGMVFRRHDDSLFRILVRETADYLGLSVPAGAAMVNLPRHRASCMRRYLRE